MEQLKQKTKFEPPTVRIIYVGVTAGLCNQASNNYSIPSIVEEEETW